MCERKKEHNQKVRKILKIKIKRNTFLIMRKLEKIN